MIFHSEEHKKVYQQYCDQFSGKMKDAKTYAELHSAFMQSVRVREYIDNFVHHLGLPNEVKISFVEVDNIYSDMSVQLLVTCELCMLPKFQTKVIVTVEKLYFHYGVTIRAPEICKDYLFIVLHNADAILTNI
jgi:hypothetical protein